MEGIIALRYPNFLHKIITVKVYIENESLTLAGVFQLNAVLRICKLALMNKNCQQTMDI